MGENDMDAFKELVRKSPDVELMAIEDLHGLVFWAGAAAKWANMQISLAKDIGGLSEQIDAWYRDGKAANDLELSAKMKRGELARSEPQEIAGGGLPGRSGGSPGTTSAKPPKWQRLGYKSEKDMHNDEFLQSHPKEIEEVKKEAEENKEFVTTTAVKNKVRANRAEKIAKEAKERAEKRKLEETDKEVEENKRFVSEYFRQIKMFTESVEKAIIGAEKGKFDPAGKNFITEKHNKLRGLLEKMEPLI